MKQEHASWTKETRSARSKPTSRYCKVLQKKGNSEVTVISNVSDTTTEPVDIRQTKNLEKTDAVKNQIKVIAGTSTQSEILSLIVSDYEMSDSEFDNNVLGDVRDFS